MSDFTNGLYTRVVKHLPADLALLARHQESLQKATKVSRRNKITRWIGNVQAAIDRERAGGDRRKSGTVSR
jgi:hypothetical protein